MTVSLGVSTILPRDEQDSSTLLERADKAFYRAKDRGRNRVETL